jgi:hypothetical protein
MDIFISLITGDVGLAGLQPVIRNNIAKQKQRLTIIFERFFISSPCKIQASSGLFIFRNLLFPISFNLRIFAVIIHHAIPTSN